MIGERGRETGRRVKPPLGGWGVELAERRCIIYDR